MNRIEELQEQIKQIREEEKAQAKEKYKYLVGTCLRSAFTSFHLVTAIDRADGESVTYECVRIYMDERFADSETQISNKSWCSIEIEDLERCKVMKGVKVLILMNITLPQVSLWLGESMLEVILMDIAGVTAKIKLSMKSSHSTP